MGRVTGAVFPGIEGANSIFQCKFLPFSTKSVNPSVNLPPANGNHQAWRPTTAVILANECGQEPVIKAECACPFINAFATPETAERWRATHPELVMQVLTQEQALTEAHNIFGAHLEEPSSAG